MNELESIIDLIAKTQSENLKLNITLYDNQKKGNYGTIMNHARQINNLDNEKKIYTKSINEGLLSVEAIWLYDEIELLKRNYHEINKKYTSSVIDDDLSSDPCIVLPPWRRQRQIDDDED